MRKLYVTTLSVVVLALGLAACSSDDMDSMSQSSTSRVASNAVFNAADVRFARQMIPHHAQALEMAELAPTRASSPAVKSLASRIQAAQQPEIDQMTEWLRSWKQEVPSATGMEMDSASSMGMMTAAEMSDLTAASGAEFDTTFLQMMIQHHTSAVEMAKTQVENGKLPQVKALAQAIVDGQESEIAEMQQLLNGS